MVHKLIALVLELFATNEDLIVGFNVWNSVRESILNLTSKIAHAAVQDLDLDLIALWTCSPLVFLNEVQDSLNYCEECVVRVARDNNKQTKDRAKESTHLVKLINKVSFNLLPKVGEATCFFSKVFIHRFENRSQ